MDTLLFCPFVMLIFSLALVILYFLPQWHQRIVFSNSNSFLSYFYISGCFVSTDYKLSLSLWSSEESIRNLGTGCTDGRELPFRYQEWNPVLEEHVSAFNHWVISPGPSIFKFSYYFILNIGTIQSLYKSLFSLFS